MGSSVVIVQLASHCDIKVMSASIQDCWTNHPKAAIPAIGHLLSDGLKRG